MSKSRHETGQCSICGRVLPHWDFAPAESIRTPILVEIREQVPDWDTDRPICNRCLNGFRAEHMRRLLEDEKGELTALETQVLDSMREQDLMVANVNERFERQLTFGERLSDQLASFGGSWSFLISFTAVVLLWMVFNFGLLGFRVFDPYPFILLNLVLSCLAAIQAPVILMSQKRQEAKDRLRSENDFQVDFRAELEVRLLHAKMDQLLTHQWQRLLEIQQLQMELMEQVARRRSER